jgi:hypothetical protein
MPAAIKIGTRFFYSHADSTPQWEVTEAPRKGLYVAVVVDSVDWNGTRRGFTESEVRVGMEVRADVVKRMDEQAQFYAGLKVGDVYHYDSGRQAYVRCEVVIDTPPNRETRGPCLKPIALVGKWSQMDLPRRRLDGTVDLGYHAERIRKGEAFTPHTSNIYEVKPGRGLDPRKATPIDLSLPPMAPEEVRKATLWAKVGELRDLVLSERRAADPEKILMQARKILEGQV